MLIPIPKYEESEVEVTDSSQMTEKFKQFWYVNDWTCPKCNARMFGRMTYCIYCKQRLNTHTERPKGYDDNSNL